jgi:hypothetical protein
MVRIVSQPDFLFSAEDVTPGVPAVLFLARTGTTNWLNNAAANGNPNGAGLGVIRPQVQSVFNKLGRQLYNLGSISDEQVLHRLQFWASFEDSTNAPVVYPIPRMGKNQMTVRTWLQFAWQIQEGYVWQQGSLPDAQFAMQTSTNLMNWTTLFAVTNNGSVCTYVNDNPASAIRFYRLPFVTPDTFSCILTLAAKSSRLATHF